MEEPKVEEVKSKELMFKREPQMKKMKNALKMMKIQKRRSNKVAFNNSKELGIHMRNMGYTRKEVDRKEEAEKINKDKIHLIMHIIILSLKIGIIITSITSSIILVSLKHFLFYFRNKLE